MKRWLFSPNHNSNGKLHCTLSCTVEPVCSIAALGIWLCHAMNTGGRFHCGSLVYTGCLSKLSGITFKCYLLVPSHSNVHMYVQGDVQLSYEVEVQSPGQCDVSVRHDGRIFASGGWDNRQVKESTAVHYTTVCAVGFARPSSWSLFAWYYAFECRGLQTVPDCHATVLMVPHILELMFECMGIYV